VCQNNGLLLYFPFSVQIVNYNLNISCYTCQIFYIRNATNMDCSKSSCSFLADIAISNYNPPHCMVLVSSAFLKLTQIPRCVTVGICKIVAGPNFTWYYKGIWKSGYIFINGVAPHQMAVCQSELCSNQFITNWKITHCYWAVGGYNT